MPIYFIEISVIFSSRQLRVSSIYCYHKVWPQEKDNKILLYFLRKLFRTLKTYTIHFYPLRTSDHPTL